MTLLEIIELIALIITILSALGGLFTAYKKGEIKNFIIKKMEEAEKKFDNGGDRLKYVTEEVKKEYDFAGLFVNLKKFIEKVISITKQINHK